MHGDLCKHLGIDSSTDHPDRYSNIFLNAYVLTWICWYLRILPVLHRPEVVDIGVNTI